jgi:hypothetical protein
MKQVSFETIYETIISWDEDGGNRSHRELARRIEKLYTNQPHSEGFWCNDLTCKKCYSADFRFRHPKPAAQLAVPDGWRLVPLPSPALPRHPPSQIPRARIEIGQRPGG